MVWAFYIQVLCLFTLSCILSFLTLPILRCGLNMRMVAVMTGDLWCVACSVVCRLMLGFTSTPSLTVICTNGNCHDQAGPMCGCICHPLSHHCTNTCPQLVADCPTFDVLHTNLNYVGATWWWRPLSLGDSGGILLQTCSPHTLLHCSTSKKIRIGGMTLTVLNQQAVYESEVGALILCIN